LEGAIEQLGVDVAGKVALDSGLSTGGFTDCLLQYGASHVYGVDVGYGQVTYITLHYFLGYFGRGKGGVKVTSRKIEPQPSSSHISYNSLPNRYSFLDPPFFFSKLECSRKKVKFIWSR
jgi:predicted RNA methylase